MNPPAARIVRTALPDADAAVHRLGEVPVVVAEAEPARRRNGSRLGAAQVGVDRFRIGQVPRDSAGREGRIAL